jgi:hypothetical protein
VQYNGDRWPLPKGTSHQDRAGLTFDPFWNWKFGSRVLRGRGYVVEIISRRSFHKFVTPARYQIKRETKRRKWMKRTAKLHHYGYWVLHLSAAFPLLISLLQQVTYYFLIDVDNSDAKADIGYSCPSIASSSETLWTLHKNWDWKSRHSLHYAD